MDAAKIIGLAIMGGIATAFQRRFMGIMEQRMGWKECVFITYVSGGILVALAMLAVRGGNLVAWPKVPWYVFTAGVLGLLIVGTIGYTVPRLGMAKAFTVMIAAQLIAAMMLDHFGLFGATVRMLNMYRMTGFIIMVVGVWMVLK